MKYLAVYSKNISTEEQHQVIKTRLWEFDADSDESAITKAKTLFYAKFMDLDRLICLDHEVDIT